MQWVVLEIELYAAAIGNENPNLELEYHFLFQAALKTKFWISSVHESQR